MSKSFRNVYLELLKKGKINHDKKQIGVLDELEELEKKLLETVSSTGLIERIFRKKPITNKGLYLWGSVGRGKSMLMDLFFDHIPITQKRRFHYLTFIQDIHDHLKEIRHDEVEDVIPPLANILVQDAKLLCLDEFQIDNVPDGVIVGRLLENLFEKETILFTTSNRKPSELYKDGLNRHLIEPYIGVLNSNLSVVEFGGQLDHRKSRLSGRQTYFYPSNDYARTELEKIWNELSDGHSEQLRIEVKGREIYFPQFSRGVLKAHFWDLCGQPLGPQDFLAIANHIKVLILEDVPLLSRQNYNEAKRFVMLVDTLYENKIHFFLSAASSPDKLYIEGNESFEFNRAVSRLYEMQGKNWGH
ncbi:MAG: cell division protein ZapE [Paracoccaceae bacterium]|nr:cell division protein ZapE [Paracoccaceae bacterium]MDE2917424.1 cell division protein ZapE [Paracoccaceae bacterium]